MDPSADPTLRPGDVVATQTGLVAFNGTKTKRGGTQTAEFIPVAKSALSPERPPQAQRRHHRSAMSAVSRKAG